MLLFPFSVKQQKSMAANVRFQKKQREIMEKYGTDRVKANEELQKLMQKENVSKYDGGMLADDCAYDCYVRSLLFGYKSSDKYTSYSV